MKANSTFFSSTCQKENRQQFVMHVHSIFYNRHLQLIKIYLLPALLFFFFLIYVFFMPPLPSFKKNIQRVCHWGQQSIFTVKVCINRPTFLTQIQLLFFPISTKAVIEGPPVFWFIFCVPVSKPVSNPCLDLFLSFKVIVNARHLCKRSGSEPVLASDVLTSEKCA